MKSNDKLDTFFQVSRISKKTTLGAVALPMFFRDASNVIVVFRANAAGREIWGYPKFVAQIPFTLDRHSFRSEVKDPQGESIMHLAGKLHFGITAPALSGITYSHLNNKLLRATVNARGHYKAYLAHHLRLKIGSSAHNMAENLRALGLDNSRPVTALVCHNFQSRLSDGFEFEI